MPENLHDILRASHRAEFAADLFYQNVKVGTLPVGGGSVSADAKAGVRRTAELNVDPTLLDKVTAGTISPYGYYVKLYRGVRYRTGAVELVCIFTGRIEQIDLSLRELRVTCSDLNADVIDAKFTEVWPVARGVQIRQAMKDIILNVKASFVVNLDTADTTVTTVKDQYEQDRQGALDALADQIGVEWFADMNGVFHIRDLPALALGQQPQWIIDTGSQGVLISRAASLSRTGVHNAVIVAGESLNGLPVVGSWFDLEPTSPTRWDGPYGKVPFLADPKENILSKPQADRVATRIGTTMVAPARSVDIECVPNPQVQLNDLIEVKTGQGLDGLYFISALTVPLEPETPTRIQAVQARAVVT